MFKNGTHLFFWSTNGFNFVLVVVFKNIDILIAIKRIDVSNAIKQIKKIFYVYVLWTVANKDQKLEVCVYCYLVSNILSIL